MNLPKLSEKETLTLAGVGVGLCMGIFLTLMFSSPDYEECPTVSDDSLEQQRMLYEERIHNLKQQHRNMYDEVVLLRAEVKMYRKIGIEAIMSDVSEVRRQSKQRSE